MNYLISFVGANTLPIYETTLYVCEREKEKFESVYLLYTNEVKDYAFALNNAMKNDELCTTDKVELILIQNEKEKIWREITNVVNVISNYQNSRVYFFLSGGTKRMSIYGYLNILNCRHNIELIVLDLDGRNNKLWVYEQNRTELIELEDYAYCLNNMDLERVFGLYNMKFIENSNCSLSCLFPSREHEKLFEVLIREREKVKEKAIWKEVKDVTIEQIDELYGAIRELPIYIKSENTSIFNIADFYKDKWLEYYIQFILKSIMSSKEKVYRSIKSSSGSHGMETEFDVGTIYIGKLYYISCTTSNDKSSNTIKTYEALFRANQLGGELACVIHVGFLVQSTKQVILNEIQEFNAKQNLHIISIEDIDMGINHLENKFREILGIKEE